MATAAHNADIGSLAHAAIAIAICPVPTGCRGGHVEPLDLADLVQHHAD